MSPSLRQRNVLLTGASSGIGQAVASELIAQGMEVWGTARDTARLNPCPHFHPLPLDLARPESIQRAFAQAEAESGGIDVLINNAGNALVGPVASFSDAELTQQFQVLVAGPLALTRLAIAAMKPRGAGMIIQISSIGAQFPIPYMGPYSACKAALSMMTDSLIVECGALGIRFVDLRPGDIRTGFNAAVGRTAEPLSVEDQSALDHGWEILEREMAAAPGPEVVAVKIAEIIQKSLSGRYCVGGFFQTRVAPLAERLLPRSWILAALRRYYAM